MWVGGWGKAIIDISSEPQVVCPDVQIVVGIAKSCTVQLT